MQLPFPALTGLLLDSSDDDQDLVIPDTFLGGSAPRLQSLTLFSIPFPGIHNLLQSATHLVDLDLGNIPHSSYISPEMMATCLSVLTSLRNLSLSLEIPSSRLRRRPPPTTRSILPNLNRFSFKGASKYLDELVALVDAPRLDSLTITFTHQWNIDTPHLVQFISRTPRFEEPNEARVNLDLDREDLHTEVQLLWPSDDYGRLRVGIYCEESVFEISTRAVLVPTIAQVCTMCLPRLSVVENLKVGLGSVDIYVELGWTDYVKNDQWLELLRPFPAVKSLYLHEEFKPILRSPCKSLLEAERWKSYPPCRISSWNRPGEPNLSRKPLLDSSLLPDGFPVIQ
jgi:hypothetical protein